MSGMPPHPLVAYQRVIHYEVLKLHESPSALRVVGDGFIKSYGLYEGIRFVYIWVRTLATSPILGGNQQHKRKQQIQEKGK